MKETYSKYKDSDIEWLVEIPEYLGVLELRNLISEVKTGGLMAMLKKQDKFIILFLRK